MKNPKLGWRSRPAVIFARSGAIVIIGIVTLSHRTEAAIRYVSPTGADSANGTSMNSPWKTINKVNQSAIAGDTILFKGGQTFVGGIDLGPLNGGTVSNLVTFSSYNPVTGAILASGAVPSSRAVIDASSADGFASYNSGGYVIRNLNFVGPGRDVATKDGIKFYVDSGTGRQPKIEIDQVDVSGFKTGIFVGGFNMTTGGNSYGYEGITITATNSFDNKLTGIYAYGNRLNSHRNLVIRGCTAYRNRGDATATSNSGNGILVNGVTTGLVEHCRAFENGDIGFGSVGIWTYGVDGITIQYCESYNNRASKTSDGGGFDLDGGTVNSIMQYNYSHGNDGAGYLMAQYGGANTEYGPLSNNIIRYNISENDARRRSYGGIMFWGANTTDIVGTTYVYGNTVYMGGSVTDGTPSCVRFLGSNFSGLKLYNNIFIAATGKRTVSSDSAMATSKAVFLRNNYWAESGASFQLKWGATTYNSLSDWLVAAANQETVDSTKVGLSVDPMLNAPAMGGTLGDTALLPTLSAYKLKVGSPMVDTALNLTQSPYSLSVGLRDYYGNNLPLGAGYDIGAHERNAYADRDGDGIPDDYEEANGMNANANDLMGDSDGDGLSNLLEYAFGLSPQARDNLPVEFDIAAGSLLKRGVPVTWNQATAGGTDCRAVFLRRKDFTAARLRYVPHFSADLSAWVEGTVVPTVIAQSGEMELVSVPYPLLVSGNKGHFFRLLVSANN